MLTKLTLENFKVFKNRTEIDFTPTRYPYRRENVAANGVLKGAVFVGANASGKSSVLEAIKLLLDLLFAEKDVDIERFISFIPDEGRSMINNHACVQYDFLIAGRRVSYRFTFVHRRTIKQEVLTIDDQIVMCREDLVARYHEPDHAEKQYDQDVIVNNKLFLRTLYFNTNFQGNDVLQEWMEFLRSSMYLHQSQQVFTPYASHDKKDIYQYLEEFGTSQFNDFFEAHDFKYKIDYKKLSEPFSEKSEGVIIFKRRMGRIEEFPIPEFLESTGNQALVRVLHVLFVALSRPCMLLIDEFSHCLHNDLEELLVKYFMKHAQESQFFIVTHSTNLLSNFILRPDQEFAVEFAEEQGSRVKRFSEEKPRYAKNIERLYLGGVFGGIPRYQTNDENDQD